MWTKAKHWMFLFLLTSLWAQGLLSADAQTPVPKTIHLYLKQTEAKDAFNLLSKASGQNLVLNNQLNGQVSLRLQNVSFEEALNALCLSLGATYIRAGGVYVVAQPSSDKPMPFLSSNPEAQNSDTDPGQRIVSVNVKNGTVDNVLQDLANQAGVEIIIMGDIKGSVTTRLQSMPFEDALKTILAGSKLSYIRDGNRFIVADPDTSNGLVQKLSKSELIEFNNITAKSFMDMLPPEIDATQLKVNSERNAVLVTGLEHFVSKVKGYAKMADVAQPQVSLEINIVEVSKTGLDQLTLLSPQIKWDFVKTVKTMQFTMINQQITSLVNQGRATLKGRPSISTISGHKAKINISDDLNFTLTSAVGTGAGTTITSNLQTINAGTLLEVTPTVGRDGLIHTDLNVEVSGVSGYSVGPNNSQIPNVRRRQANTSVNVLDGETIMIAGLSQLSDQKNYTKIPLIGNIPVVGDWAASHNNNKNSSELVIFVTPHLIEARTQINPQAALPIGTPADNQIPSNPQQQQP